MSIRTIINGQAISYTNASTGFISLTKNSNGVYNGLCQVCHTKAKFFKNYSTPDLTHMSANGKNCLDCHTHKAAMFAFQATAGGCGGCHGYPPASSTIMSQPRLNNYTNAKLETTAGAGGAHTVAGHIPKNAKQDDGWANCSSCHYNTGHNNGVVNVIVDTTKYKFNNNSAIKYNAKTCSNVSCHFKPTPNWTTGN